MEEPSTVWIEGIWDVDTFYKRRWDQISYDDNIQYQKTKKDLGSMKDIAEKNWLLELEEQWFRKAEDHAYKWHVRWINSNGQNEIIKISSSDNRNSRAMIVLKLWRLLWCHVNLEKEIISFSSYLKHFST